MQETCQQRVLELDDLLATLEQTAPSCDKCARVMQVQKTLTRHGVTLTHGTFHVQQRVYVCPSGCRQSGHSPGRRAPTLAAVLPPRSVVGYDVMVAVGLERFVHHRQREEIRARLAHEHGLVLSTGEISTLERRFLVYLEALHKASAPALAAALKADGGWPLHLDATCEDGRGTLLVAYTSWRHWALGAWKITTERAEFILPAIQEVANAFGPPCGIMRDLGHAMSEAAESFVSSLPVRIPILACHYHFLADVGGDLLRNGHDQLRALFRQAEILPDLRAFVRQRGDRLGSSIEEGREGVRGWLAESSAGHRLPDGRTGLTAVRGLAQWILDYRADSSDAGFPFDTPFLALYDRCLQVGAAAEVFLRDAPSDRAVKSSLTRLQKILGPIDCDVPPFLSVASTLTRRVELFNELREALRFNARNPETAGKPDEPITPQGIEGIQHAVNALEVSLRERRPTQQTAKAKDLREAIDIVLTHLERHGPNLWGHAIPTATASGPAVRLIPRTNNCLESCFHGMKHRERRRSGRKVLTHDFETVPAAAALAVNLTRADYVEIVCGGSLQRLPSAFAKLDAENHSRSIAARSAPTTVPVETASLSTADRRLVRMPALGDKILAAARTRMNCL